MSVAAGIPCADPLGYQTHSSRPARTQRAVVVLSPCRPLVSVSLKFSCLALEHATVSGDVGRGSIRDTDVDRSNNEGRESEKQLKSPGLTVDMQVNDLLA